MPSAPLKRRISFSSGTLRRLSLFSLLWLSTVVVGSLLPVKTKIAIGTVGTAHDLVHVVVFACTAVVLMLWARTKAQEFCLASVAFMIGVVLEIVQKLMTGNSIEWGDIQTDCIGSLLALLCMQFRAVRRPLECLAHRGLKEESQ